MTTAIIGRTGTGKSFTAKGMVEIELAAGARVCVIDPTGAWWGLRLAADGQSEGFPVVIFGGDHADVPIDDSHGVQLADLVVAGEPRQCVIDVSDMSGNEQTRFLTAFLERLYTKNRQPILLVLDEADVMAPQNPMPDQRRLQGAVNKIVRRGRIKGFRPIMITQRPAVLDKSVMSMIDTLIAMQLTSPQDRKAIEEWVKGNADGAEAKAVLGSLASLPRGEGWYWEPAAGVLERRTFPAIVSFDSGRTPEPGEEVRDVTPLALPQLEALRAAFLSADPADATAATTRTPSNGNAQAAIAAAEQRGFDRGRADGATAESHRIRAATLADVGRLAVVADELVTAIAKIRDGFIDPVAVASASGPDRKLLENACSVAAVAPQPEPKNAPKRQPRDPGQATGVTPAKKALLDAIAWLTAFGNGTPSRVQVALVAGVSHVSSSYSNNLGALRTAGLIEYPQPTALALTNAGWQIAERPEQAPSHQHVMDLLRNRLQPALMRLLDELTAVHPGYMSRQQLADAAGVSASSSSFSNNLGRLSSLGLVAYPAKGAVRAEHALFPDRG